MTIPNLQTFILYCEAIVGTVVLVAMGKVPPDYLIAVFVGVGLHASVPTGANP